MSAPVSELALACYAKGELTGVMREAIISIMYKGKGERDLWKFYRPVSLTDSTMRIIDKAMQMALNKAVPTVLCGVNRAFLPGERIEHDTLTMAETARYCRTRRQTRSRWRRRT